MAGKGTSLPGGALWTHFRKLGAYWSQLSNVAQNTAQAMSTTHVNHSARTKVQGQKHNGSKETRVQLQNRFFSQKNEMAPQCTGAIARGQNRRPIGSWGGQLKGPHGDCHTAQSTGPQLSRSTQKIIVTRALGAKN